MFSDAEDSKYTQQIKSGVKSILPKLCTLANTVEGLAADTRFDGGLAKTLATKHDDLMGRFKEA